MNRKLILASLALVASAASQAATVTETRALAAPVTAISLEGPVDLVLSQGETRGVEVVMDDAERQALRLELSGTALRIVYAPERRWLSLGDSRPSPRVRLSVSELDKLAIKGSGDVHLQAFDLAGKDIHLEIHGSGDLLADRLRARSLRSAIAGSGDMKLSGQVDTQSVSISGSGDYQAPELQARETRVSIAGSGDSAVWATERLDVSIAGSGDVRYRGQPRLTQSIAGSGAVSASR